MRRFHKHVKHAHPVLHSREDEGIAMRTRPPSDCNDATELLHLQIPRRHFQPRESGCDTSIDLALLGPIG